MKAVLTGAFCCIVLASFSQEVSAVCCERADKKNVLRSTVFDAVEDPPYFGTCNEFVPNKRGSYSCSDENINKYVRNHIEASEFLEAMTFTAIILSTGCIVEVEDFGLTKESEIRSRTKNILSSMPCWVPGKQNGKSVSSKVRMMIE